MKTQFQRQLRARLGLKGTPAPAYTALAEVYDAVISDQVIGEWRGGICRLLKAHGITTGSVLDIGSGTGVGARALSEVGTFTIDGIDRSQDMILRCCPNLYRTVFHGQFPDVLIGHEHYDLVCCGADTFNYIHPRRRSHFIAAVQKVLVPGGYFAVDTLSRRIDSFGGRATPAVLVELTYQTGARVITQLTAFEKKSCTSIFVFQNSDGTNSVHEIHVQYYCSRGTLAHIMRTCGFSLVAVTPVSLARCLLIEKNALLWRRNGDT